MSATPQVPTEDIFAQTIGSTNQPGQLHILNGKLIFSSGTSITSYDLLLDGLNKLIKAGSGGEVTIDGANKRIDVGTSGEIRLDGTNKRIDVGTSGEIQLDGTNKRIQVGNTNVLIDGLNKRIIINDGTNDRVLIGYYSGLF